jgi:hypothetical protein
MAAAVLAIAVGLAINCKIHGFLYLLPVGAVWFQRNGFRSLVTVIVLAGIVAMIPFLLPGVLQSGYLAWLRLATGHSLRKSVLADNLMAFITLLIPLALLPCPIDWARLLRWLNETNLLFISLVGVGLLVCVPASKAGAGPHHLLPLAPYVGYLLASRLAVHPLRDWNPWCLVIGFLWVVCSYPQTFFVSRPFWDRGQDRLAGEAITDLRAILSGYNPQDIQMGCGGKDHYGLTFDSPWIYKFGAPRVTDPASCMDIKASGLTLRPLEESLRNKIFKIWLIPRGDQPFSMISYYDDRPLFDDSVAQTLLRNYSIVESARFYDVYQANGSLH